MATVTLTSGCNTNLPQALAYENNNTHLRDASFSSYLGSAEETFVLKLPESTQNLSPTITTPQEPPCPISLRRKKNDGEISIFSAEKYFNGGMDEKPKIGEKSARKHQLKKVERIDLNQVKPKIRLGTPSASSEASWNSQSALLRSLVRNQLQSKQNKVHGKRFFTSFGCNCSCSDKKSVDIDENVGDNKSSKTSACGEVHSKEIAREPIKVDRDLVDLIGIKQSQLEPWVKEKVHCQKFDKVGLGLKREACLTFPVLNSGVGNGTVNRQFKGGKEEEKARDSLEVFGSPVLEKKDIALSIERRLTMLTWDTTPRVEDIPATSGGRTYDEIESDASSDLFEIESLSSNSHPFFTRQISDGVSSCMTPTTCYEPSEASIEWSVATASAANFSTASDYDERRPAAFASDPNGMFPTKTTAANANTTVDKEVQRRRPSMLSGCRSHKAVKVAEDIYRTNDKAKSEHRIGLRSDSFTPMTRFQAKTKMIDFQSAHAQRAFGSLSHSARESQSLYMR